MTDLDDEDQHAQPGFTIPPWNAVSITQQRAELSRAGRDAAIEDLRQQMSEQQILTQFGIDLGQIEG
jgi:hypothetical protein